MVFVAQLGVALATAVVAGFGVAIGWRKGNQAAEALDRLSASLSAKTQEKMETALAKLRRQSVAAEGTEVPAS